MAAHQASSSLEFSREEYWSGLPFPSPMHESEKWKWSSPVVSCFYWPHGLQPTRLLCCGIFQARVLEWVAIAFSLIIPRRITQSQNNQAWSYLPIVRQPGIDQNTKNWNSHQKWHFLISSTLFYFQNYCLCLNIHPSGPSQKGVTYIWIFTMYVMWIGLSLLLHVETKRVGRHISPKWTQSLLTWDDSPPGRVRQCKVNSLDKELVIFPAFMTS